MDYKDFSIDLAKKSGKIMKEYFKAEVKKDWKADNTPVTEADLKINQLVIDSVREHFPSHGIIAEEGSNFSGEEFVWVCDPIDGTIPFSHGIPTCAFSLALVHNGVPILGVIYDPFIDRLFLAEKGKGSFLNGKKIMVSKINTLERSVVGMSAARKDSLSVVGELATKKAKIVGLWSIVYSGMLVASGELVASVARVKNPWDVAALKIVVDEAGGKVTDLFGEDQRYDGNLKGCLMTNGLVHDEILEIIRKHDYQFL